MARSRYRPAFGGIGPAATGTFKRGFAAHQCSPRRNGPFVVLDCSAIPEQLFEDQSFVLLTRSYLKDRFEELKTTMAIMQAVNTRTRRFIPVQREQFHMPLYIQAFAGIDMPPQREMKFRSNMDRLIKRLKQEPHER